MSEMNALQSTVTTITRHFPFFIREPATWLIGQKCYHSLIYDFNYTDVECIKYSISKGLGFGIVLGASIVKLPQIYTIVNEGSCRGLSLVAYILETFSYAITLSYAARNAFPFSTYGENLFLTIQNVIITLLIVWYSPPKGGKTRSLTGGGGGKDGNGNWKGLGVGVGVILVSAWILGSETLSPPNVLTFLLSWTIPLTILSKAPQILSNYRLHSTGTLSAFAVFNALLGCIARLFTTSQETGDNLVWWGYALAAGLNTVLAGQMIMYWEKKQGGKGKSLLKGKGKGKEREKVLNGGDIPMSPIGNDASWGRKDL